MYAILVLESGRAMHRLCRNNCAEARSSVNHAELVLLLPTIMPIQHGVTSSCLQELVPCRYLYFIATHTVD